MSATTWEALKQHKNLNTFEHVARVIKVRFFDEESGAVIAELAGGVGCKGVVDGGPLDEGKSYRFLGRWREDGRWGKVFHFDTYTVDVPADKRGVIRYLVEICDGIGQAIAGKIWDAYGPECVTTLRENPGQCADDGHCTIDVACQASRCLERNIAFEKTRIELATLFAGRGFGRAAVKACIGKWGVKAAELIRRNPWLLLLAEIPGAGFKRVDRVYLENGGNPARLKRQMLAGWDALRQGIDGNTWHPLGALRKGVIDQVGAREANLAGALALGIRAGWLTYQQDESERDWVAEAQAAQNESDLAIHLRELMRAGPGQWPAVAPPDVSEHQAAEWAKVCGSHVCLLAGTPGTGKTYLAAAMLRVLIEQVGAGRIAVCAPTGKAAVRITEAMTAHRLPLEATTIHRLLEIGRNGHDGKGWGFLRNETRPLDQAFVVVDEASMIDTDLAASLMRACARGTQLLFVGDPFQLPPVGHGAPLRDMMSGGVPCAELTEIKRNAGTIVTACKEIKEGRRFKTVDVLNADAGENLRLIECEDEEAQVLAMCRILTALQESGKRDPVWDCQVLTPLNEKSGVSREPLNVKLQALLNPLAGEKALLQVGEFRVGDKLICLRNCGLNAMDSYRDMAPSDFNAYKPARDRTGQTYQTFIANGDQARVEAIDVPSKTLIARFRCPDRLVKIPLGKGETDSDGSKTGAASDFALAYAITGHKSQGSEWPVVVVMIDQAAGSVACREWVYTAISRAKGACILLGRRGVVDRQCAKVSLKKRKTFLQELLCNQC